MFDWKAALKTIYYPETGTIWAAPNGIWNNGFARNRSVSELHPSVVERMSTCKTIAYLVPGTSKNYSKGACVYKVTLNEEDIDCPQTHFLLSLSMAVPKDDVVNLDRGWNGVDTLSYEQVTGLKLQIKFCKGLHV